MRLPPTVDMQGAEQVCTPDFDCDGDVDLEDIVVFVGCWTGPGNLYYPTGLPAECTLEIGADGRVVADQDSDGDVDQEDFGILQRCLGEFVCTE